MDNNAVKNTLCDKLAIKVNAIDTNISSTRGLVTKTQDDSDKQGIEKRIEDVDKKIPNTSELVNKTYYNVKITGFKNKIPRTTPDITNLITKSALNTKSAEVKNKILDTRGFLSTPEFDRLTKMTQELNMIKGIN